MLVSKRVFIVAARVVHVRRSLIPILCLPLWIHSVALRQKEKMLCQFGPATGPDGTACYELYISI